MVIDTSALIAILLGEPEADALAHAVADEPKRMLSAFSALEAYITPPDSISATVAHTRWRSIQANLFCS